MIADLFTVKLRVEALIRSRCKEISRRLDLGIYATDKDRTVNEVHEELRALHAELADRPEVSKEDFARLDELTNELYKRGYFET